MDTLQAAGATVLETDAFRFLLAANERQFDLVFIDPPFAADSQSELCRLLAEGSLLADNARVYIEEDRAKPALELPAQWQVLKSKQAGNVRYSLVDAGAKE